ncbi:phosphotransferase, partial [Proteus mirabilis]|uniref:phosphotransferase n=1 Tax=Proteus mirabilis TaxID=584 RepID=UPI00313B68EA
FLAPQLDCEPSECVPTPCKSQVSDAIENIIHEVSPTLSDSTWKKLRLHGDCHPGNILWRDEVVIVDFDDSRMVSAIQDFW